MNQNESKQSFLAHLTALRKVLIVSAAAICIAFLVVFYGLIDQLMALLIQPIVDRGIDIIYTAMSEALEKLSPYLSGTPQWLIRLLLRFGL